MTRVLVAAGLLVSAFNSAWAISAPKYYAPSYSAVIRGACRPGYVYYRYNCVACTVPGTSLRVVGGNLYCVWCPPGTAFDGQRYCRP